MLSPEAQRARAFVRTHLFGGPHVELHVSLDDMVFDEEMLLQLTLHGAPLHQVLQIARRIAMDLAFEGDESGWVDLACCIRRQWPAN